MALSSFFLQELKSRNDLSEIAASYVNLKRRGKNLIGLCPFHNEKTPSFNIYPDNGSFYCFGCSTGGDVITFVMKIENLDYIEAVRFLAQRAGMQMPEDGVDDSMAKLKMRILEINRETARFYHQSLYEQTGQSAYTYLRQRGLDNRTIKRFGLGYAPNSGFALVNYLKAKNYSQSELVQANVAGISQKGNAYDRFRNRVMFPIIDLRGNVVAFGGRIMTDEKPKYINTSDTPVYHKSNGLFAMNFAKDSKTKQLILAEGYMDVIALHKAGFTNAIASLGTSLTDEQARIISRYADEAVICYDADDAGQRAAQRAIPILKKTGLLVKVLTIPGNKDPDEFIKAHGENGAARFKSLLESCGNDVEYRLQKLKSNYAVETETGRIQFLQKAVLLLCDIEDRIAQDVYIRKLSEDMDVDRNAISDMVRKEVSKRNKKRDADRRKTENRIYFNDVKSFPHQDMKLIHAEESILAFLFNNQNYIEEIHKKLPPEKMITAHGHRVYEAFLGKNIHGEFSITDFSGEFTAEELSYLTRVLATRKSTLPTRADIDAYLDVLINEKGYDDPKKVKEAGMDEIQDYLGRLRNQKNRGNG